MIATSLLLCLASLSQDAGFQDLGELAGRWAGGYLQPGEYVSMEVRFEESEAGLAALIALPERGFRLEAPVERKGKQVSWTVSDDEGGVRAHFEGRLDGTKLRGNVSGGAVEGKPDFDLLRVVELDQERLGRYEGTYRLDEDTTLRIVRVRRALDDALGIEFPAEDLRALLFRCRPRSWWRVAARCRSRSRRASVSAWTSTARSWSSSSSWARCRS